MVSEEWFMHLKAISETYGWATSLFGYTKCNNCNTLTFWFRWVQTSRATAWHAFWRGVRAGRKEECQTHNGLRGALWLSKEGK